MHARRSRLLDGSRAFAASQCCRGAPELVAAENGCSTHKYCSTRKYFVTQVKICDLGCARDFDLVDGRCTTTNVGSAEYRAPELVDPNATGHGTYGHVPVAGLCAERGVSGLCVEYPACAWSSRHVLWGGPQSVSEAPTGSRQHALAAGTAVDMWSFGVIAYVLLTSKLPFGDRFQPNGSAALAQRILRGVYAPLSADRVRPECRGLCGGALPALVERCLQLEPGRRPTAAEALEGPFFRAY